MFKKIQSKKYVILTLAALLSSVSLHADDTPTPNPAPNPNDEITGATEVARGVVQELEDELAKHVTQTSFKASDYKAWNTQFRAKLDLATANFENALETQIAAPLKPLAAQYQEILQDQTLRPDQANALKVIAAQNLNAKAMSLGPVYGQIYADLFKSVLGFLPTASFQYTGSKENHHGLLNFGSALVDVGTLGVGVDFTKKTEAIREADFNYTVQSLDGSIAPLKGSLQITSMTTTAAAMNITSLDKVYSDADLTGCLPANMNINGVDSFKDPKGYQDDLTNTLNTNTCVALAAVDAEASGNNTSGYPVKSSAVFNQFIVGAIKSGCQSQVCLALKESDLLLTLTTLAQQLDKPFVLRFDDGETTTVYMGQVGDISAYAIYLQSLVTDSSLPFDTQN